MKHTKQKLKSIRGHNELDSLTTKKQRLTDEIKKKKKNQAKHNLLEAITSTSYIRHLKWKK